MATVSTPVGPWRYGLHPRAAGLRLRSLDRVRVHLGEALRLEMVDGEPGDEESVHMQYYIVTDAGPWALWLSCTRSELDDHEAILRELGPPPSG
jgi:hypothetical protein